jgi:hypothetical protein
MKRQGELPLVGRILWSQGWRKSGWPGHPSFWESCGKGEALLVRSLQQYCLPSAPSSGRRSLDLAGAGSMSGVCLPWSPLQLMRWSSNM